MEREITSEMIEEMLRKMDFGAYGPVSNFRVARWIVARITGQISLDEYCNRTWRHGVTPDRSGKVDAAITAISIVAIFAMTVAVLVLAVSLK